MISDNLFKTANLRLTKSLRDSFCVNEVFGSCCEDEGRSPSRVCALVWSALLSVSSDHSLQASLLVDD
jgi:hypothetical protein